MGHGTQMTFRAWGLVFAAALAACGPQSQEGAAPAAGDAVVNVYSSRHYDADGAVYAAFTKETGIAVRTLEAPGDQLIERLKAEGNASPADVIVTVDAGNLWRLKQEGLLQPAASAALEAAIPARLRDPEGHWFGFSKRARVIVHAPDRLPAAGVARYDDLAAPALKGRVCVRTSTNVYNLSLLAARIERDGAPAAAAWARGVVANFARPPEGSDTDQIKAVAAGVCDATLVNHYYLIRMQGSSDPADVAIAAKVALAIPDQAGAGAHVNVSGAGIAAHAPNRANALKLLEYLASPSAQGEFAALNDELPVVAGGALPAALQPFANIEEDETALEAYGRRQAEAVAIYDEAGWR
jgi:iron(III) transport system substrate-binding protein